MPCFLGLRLCGGSGGDFAAVLCLWLWELLTNLWLWQILQPPLLPWLMEVGV